MSAMLWPWLMALFSIPVMIWQRRRTRRQMTERLRQELERRVAGRIIEELTPAAAASSPGPAANPRT
jgi:C4-dicarboxylate-specific signal transduction histidine kinase